MIINYNDVKLNPDDLYNLWGSVTFWQPILVSMNFIIYDILHGSKNETASQKCAACYNAEWMASLLMMLCLLGDIMSNRVDIHFILKRGVWCWMCYGNFTGSVAADWQCHYLYNLRYHIYQNHQLDAKLWCCFPDNW